MRKLLALLIAAAAATLVAGAADPAAASKATLGPYGWPIKPFDVAHPVRGGFGDPRTVFHGPPTARTLLTSSGSFQFHFGIDISAPDGTAVYPVADGTVTAVHGDWLQVDSGVGRAFQYWHVTSAVAIGDRVTTDVTVLGHIVRGAGHVHLSERDDRQYVNPLAPGHLEPYGDATAPHVASIELKQSVGGPDLVPTLVRGRIELIADAYDTPSLPVPGDWHGLPVTPAVVEWRLQDARTGHVVVPERVVYDVRSVLPPRSEFWTVYARGTYQNMSVFGRHYSYMQPGSYLFRLTPGGLDTRTLADGVYEVVVTAIDIRGNRTSASRRFDVHNRPGIVGV